MTDAELQALLSAKITKDGIKSRIARADYFVIPGTTTTICNITMLNGFSVSGESNCVDTVPFDEAIGRDRAYRKALGKLWALEAYAAAEVAYIMSHE